MDEIAERYADVETCECGDSIECLDGGGYSYWVHVKRMSGVEYGHAAVPARPVDISSDEAPRGRAATRPLAEAVWDAHKYLTSDQRVSLETEDVPALRAAVEKARRERDGWAEKYGASVSQIDRLTKERDTASAAIERVRGLHVRIADNTAPKLGFAVPDLCRADGETWPCPTVAVLDGPACGPACNPATCVHMYDEHFPGEHLDDCSGRRCCPAEACEPGEPRGPGVCGYTCPCHPDFYREDR